MAQWARKSPGMVFTSLPHPIDIDWLREAYRRTRKVVATAFDGQTAEAYAKDLDENLGDLLDGNGDSRRPARGGLGAARA